MTEREAILQALFALLQTISDAKVLRNEALPEKIPDGGLIIFRDGDPGEPETLLSPVSYYWQHRALVEAVVQKGDQAARDLALASGEVYVVTGPIFAGQPQKLKDRVTVPAGFFKAIYDPQRRQAGAYVVDNREGARYSTMSIAQLAQLTGFDAFPARRLERAQYLLALGRLVPVKGLDGLLAALGPLAGVELLVAGERRGLAAHALHQTAVASKNKRAVIQEITQPVTLRHQALSNGHTDGVRNSLP